MKARIEMIRTVYVTFVEDESSHLRDFCEVMLQYVDSDDSAPKLTNTTRKVIDELIFELDGR